MRRLLSAACFAAFLAAGCATAPPAPSSSGQGRPVPAAPAGDSAGVEAVSLRKTAGGSMLDFRFRVTDPEMAAPLMSKDTPASLVDPATGVKLTVPVTKIGIMRQTTRLAEKGRVYFMFFHDPGKRVMPGEKVTVVIGEHRFENMTVQ